MRVERPHGGYLAQRYLPLDRVGICVPGGAAAYPSTVLMTAVPAQAAGVAGAGRRRAAHAVRRLQPGPAGHLPRVGHQRGLSAGRRQGVAALAYGVEGVPQVDKIVGPGNLFVALAKKHVYGEVDIDSIAGPSEVVVIADASTRPDFTAADLIAQAEHAPGASILITLERGRRWRRPPRNWNGRSAHLSRGDLARQSLEGVRRVDPGPRCRRSLPR